MRILQLHCDSIEYTPTKKEIKSAEEIEPKKTRIEEVVVCFTAIEEDDDLSVAKNAIIDIQKSMKQIGKCPLIASTDRTKPLGATNIGITSFLKQ